MAFTIGANSASTYRTLANIRKTTSLMNKTLERLSSGLKINSASDDPSGLAMGLRLKNETDVTSVIQKNVDNAKSFVDNQSTALQTAADIISEMKTLKAQHTSAVAAGTDLTGYESEFQELRSQLAMLESETFNGVSVFSNAGGSKTVNTSADGSGGVTLDDLNLSVAFKTDGTQAGGRTVDIADPAGSSMTLADANISDELDAIEDQVLELLGQSGADASALGYASSYLEVKAANLEAARSRVMDADIAEETTNLSKYTIQYEASVAALAQANATQQTVMELLLFPNK